MNLIACSRTFLAVMDTGSLTRAAQREGLSLSAVSRQITQLEAHLSRTLLYRGREGARATPAGHRYLPRARALVSAADDALETFGDELTLSGTLRVSATVTWGLARLVPLLPTLHQRAPALCVDLSLEDHPVEDLVGEGVDVAIRANIPLPDSTHYHARRLERVEAVWVASPRYLSTAAPLRTPSDLAAHEVLTSLGPQTNKVTLVGDDGPVVAHVRGPLRVRTLLARRDGAVHGLGITQLPYFVCARELESGLLERVLPGWASPRIDVFALYRTERAHDPRVRALLDVLTDDALRPPAR